MPLLTNGNYDQCIEISRELFTEMASSMLPRSQEPIKIDEQKFAAVVTASSTLRQVWFQERPLGWAANSGFGNLIRTTSDLVTLAIQIDVHINLTKLRIPVNGIATTVDLTKDPNYAPIREIDFTAFVEVHDHVQVETRTVRIDRETAETQTVPCVVIDFNPGAGIPANWPRVDVEVRRSELRNAQAIELMMAGAVLEKDDPDVAFEELVSTIVQNLQSAVRQTVIEKEEWRLAGTGRALVFAGTTPKPEPGKPPPPIVKQLGVKTLADSLIIGVDYLAKYGSMVHAHQSTLAGVPEHLGITVSNRLLLRGTIRPALVSTFGLMASDFDPGEFCVVSREVSNALLPGGRTGSIQSLAAFVDESSRLRVLMEFSTEVLPGATLHAQLDLHFGFSVERKTKGANQILEVSTRLLNPDTAVVSKRVDLSAAIYVAAGLLLDLFGLILVAIVDGIILELVVGGQLQTAMEQLQLDPKGEPVPVPVALQSADVTLHSDNAPPMPTALGPYFWLIFGAGSHDLHIGTNYAALPDPLPVTFQVPDSIDPKLRIDGIGGPLPDGSEWVLLIDDAIALVDAGHLLEVTVSTAPPAPVIAVVPKNADGSDGVPYLRTKGDDFGANNLGNLPYRIPALLGTLGPEA